MFTNAAELPDDTVVIVAPSDSKPWPNRRTVAYIRNHPGRDTQWRGTDGSHMWDQQITEMLAQPGRCRIILPEEG